MTVSSLSSADQQAFYSNCRIEWGFQGPARLVLQPTRPFHKLPLEPKGFCPDTACSFHSRSGVVQGHMAFAFDWCGHCKWSSSVRPLAAKSGKSRTIDLVPYLMSSLVLPRSVLPCLCCDCTLPPPC